MCSLSFNSISILLGLLKVSNSGGSVHNLLSYQSDPSLKLKILSSVWFGLFVFRAWLTVHQLHLGYLIMIEKERDRYC